MKFAKELVVIFIATAIPMIASYIYGGADYMVEVVKAMIVHKWIMYYTMVGTAIFFVVAFLDWWFLIRNERVERFHRFLSHVLLDSASSLLAILRISGGVLVVVSILWFVGDFNIEQLPKKGFLLFMGCVAIAECYFINQWLIYVDKNWLRRDSNTLSNRW